MADYTNVDVERINNELRKRFNLSENQLLPYKVALSATNTLRYLRLNKKNTYYKTNFPALNEKFKKDHSHIDLGEIVSNKPVVAEKPEIKEFEKGGKTDAPTLFDDPELIPEPEAEKMAQENTEPETDNVDLNPHEYANAYALNKAVEKLIDIKGSEPKDYNKEERIFISHYSGAGGLRKEDAEDRDEELTFENMDLAERQRFDFEFYTPDLLCAKMVALAHKYGYKKGSVLEPSAGTGRFLRYFPTDTDITTYEINKYSHAILKILFPHGNHNLASFETLFYTGRKGRTAIGNDVSGLKKYDLVIGNPPYGEQSSSLAVPERAYTHTDKWIEYFITRGLDVTKPGGLLIYVVGTQLMNGGKLFLDKGSSKVKTQIAEKAELIDAYRLPEGIFDRTGVTSEIVVCKKKDIAG